MATPEEINEIIRDDRKLHAVAKAAFEAVDVDHSGFIDEQELKTVMCSVAGDIGMDKPTDSDVREVLREIDANGDGKISLEEFKVLIKQVLTIMAEN